MRDENMRGAGVAGRHRVTGLRAAAVGVALAVLAGCASVSPPAGPPTGPTLPPVPVEPVAPRLPVIGLALGGGAARGFAHVGVIQVLEEAGIRPDLVVGTSAGSLVAALYASGMSGTRLEQVAMAMEEAAFTDWTLPIFSRGVLRGDALARFVNTTLSGRPIDAMTIPLGVLATDLHSGQGVLFRRGDTGTAVRASSAVPAVFLPVRIGEREYVDGGLVSPVPVRYARQMGAELVIAVDISSAPEGNAANGSLEILLQTFAIMGQSINKFELKEAEVVVRPAPDGLKAADFATRRRAIEAGRAAMRATLPHLRQQMEARSRSLAP